MKKLTLKVTIILNNGQKHYFKDVDHTDVGDNFYIVNLDARGDNKQLFNLREVLHVKLERE